MVALPSPARQSTGAAFPSPGWDGESVGWGIRGTVVGMGRMRRGGPCPAFTPRGPAAGRDGRGLKAFRNQGWPPPPPCGGGGWWLAALVSELVEAAGRCSIARSRRYGGHFQEQSTHAGCEPNSQYRHIEATAGVCDDAPGAATVGQRTGLEPTWCVEPRGRRRLCESCVWRAVAAVYAAGGPHHGDRRC
jgi:hypothetical protein